MINEMSTYLKTGYYPFAHSRPDKIGTPRLLPLHIEIFSLDYRQKKPLKGNILSFKMYCLLVKLEE